MGNTRVWTFGIVAGVIGAAIWAAIAYFLNVEVGYVAWGIGGLVGLAVAKGSDGEGSTSNAIFAVVVTVLSIAGGKYAVLEISFAQELDGIGMPSVDDIPDEQELLVFLCDELIAEKEAEGETITWPAGVDPDEATTQEEYPERIWQAVSEKWNDMDGQGKEDVKQLLIERRAAGIAAFNELIDDLKMEAFKESFGVLDILFFGLAVVTAYRIADQGASVG